MKTAQEIEMRHTDIRQAANSNHADAKITLRRVVDRADALEYAFACLYARVVSASDMDELRADAKLIATGIGYEASALRNGGYEPTSYGV